MFLPELLGQLRPEDPLLARDDRQASSSDGGHNSGEPKECALPHRSAWQRRQSCAPTLFINMLMDRPSCPDVSRIERRESELQPTRDRLAAAALELARQVIELGRPAPRTARWQSPLARRERLN